MLSWAKLEFSLTLFSQLKGLRFSSIELKNIVLRTFFFLLLLGYSDFLLANQNVGCKSSDFKIKYIGIEKRLSNNAVI
jgi:hypothetical protein